MCFKICTAYEHTFRRIEKSTAWDERLKTNISWIQCYMSIIPAHRKKREWETQGQPQIHCRSEPSLSFTSLYFKTPQNNRLIDRQSDRSNDQCFALRQCSAFYIIISMYEIPWTNCPTSGPPKVHSTQKFIKNNNE